MPQFGFTVGKRPEGTSSSFSTWEAPSELGMKAEREQHAADLREMIITKYAIGKMSAKDVCLIAYHATKAGAAGSDLSELAFQTDTDGHYERHLKTVLGHGPEAPLCKVMVPSYWGGRRQDLRGGSKTWFVTKLFCIKTTQLILH